MPTLLRSRPALFVALLLAACDQTSTDPRSTQPVQFSRNVTIPDVQSQLVTGPARVEVSVVPGTLTARRVVIEQADQLGPSGCGAASPPSRLGPTRRPPRSSWAVST